MTFVPETCLLTANRTHVEKKLSSKHFYQSSISSCLPRYWSCAFVYMPITDSRTSYQAFSLLTFCNYNSRLAA